MFSVCISTTNFLHPSIVFVNFFLSLIKCVQERKNWNNENVSHNSISARNVQVWKSFRIFNWRIFCFRSWFIKNFLKYFLNLKDFLWFFCWCRNLKLIRGFRATNHRSWFEAIHKNDAMLFKKELFLLFSLPARDCIIFVFNAKCEW